MLKRLILFILLSTLNYTAALCQAKIENDTIAAKIVLIGDAGSLIAGSPSVLNSAKKHFSFNEKTTVIFLGDNLYDYGLPDETYSRYALIKAALDSQINLINGTKAKAIMIPGNHDWANGGSEGLANVVRQQQYVDRFSAQNLNYLPKQGCPGPEEVRIRKDVTLLVFDSQWWLHTNEKPGIESDCSTKTEDEMIEELKEKLNKNFDKLVVLAMHHPFKSNGPHGGFYTLKQHIFPLTDLRKNLYIPMPIIGSVYPISRSVFGSPQDIKNPRYQNMINKVMAVVKGHPNVIFVSGHEHNLQYINDGKYNYIISGSGCKTNRVSMGREAEYVKQELGFATLDVSINKNVTLNFFTIDNSRGDSLSNGFSKKILDFSKLPEIEKQDTVPANYVYKDVVIAPASTQYMRLNGLKKVFSGTNHRKEWSEPVALKVFNINKEKGGFRIDGLGGGNQTKSLKLIDKNGEAWSLRTVDKDPDKAIPENFRNTFASSIVKDMISASHPYAPSIVPYLAEAAHIIAPKREFFFVPKDPSFGYYKNYFANKVCILEPRDPNNATDNKSTFKLMDKMMEEQDHLVDQHKVLNARLLDMLIADWDRHFDQWRWGNTDTGKGKLYYPMPKDRDQAFFRSNGLLVKFLHSNMPFLEGFTSNINKLSELNIVAKDFDRLFLNELNKQQWDSIITNFVNNLPDNTIKDAVKKFPPEIYALRGKKIEEKLINRRNQLKAKALDYYDFISKEVRLLGSNKDDIYKIDNAGEGKITITAYANERKSQDSNFVFYKRTFIPAETKEIIIYTFNGEDKLDISPNVNTPIRLRIIGGKGQDSFYINGNMKTYIYDLNTEKNSIQGTGRIIDNTSSDYLVNRFQLKSFHYPQKSFPKINLGYNVDDGVLVGGGFLFRSYKFRREPFANEHKFSSLFSLTQKGIQLKYNATFNKLIKDYDIHFNSKLNMPGISNFYGVGNNTDDSLGKRFYMARYKTLEAELLFNKPKFDRKLNIFFGPTLFHYWNRHSNNENFVLSNPKLVGLDSTDVYSKYTYIGGKLGFTMNNLNNELFPTRGIQFNNLLSFEKSISGTTNAVAKWTSDMTIYASLKIPAKVTGVIKFGGGKIFTDSTKYFQYLTIGQNSNLRGFRKNRYAGDGLLYGSLEFRIKLLDGKSYILPGQVGIIAFNDLGRVWYKKENASNKWHYAYGGGIYFVPFNTALLSATFGKSESSNVFNISIGAKFNLTF